MAITKLGSVKTTLSVAIDYILNPEKTENQKYVYCYGCTEDGKSAEQEFLAIREFGTGKGDVLAQHIKQSFKGQEVTPEQALEIGIKTAERLLENKYQYIVATHTDKDNIHNHIIFNNINFDGYRQLCFIVSFFSKCFKKVNYNSYADNCIHDVTCVWNNSV